MNSSNYKIGFFPYALAAFLIGLVGGFSTVLGPAFVQDMALPYSDTTWTSLAQAISTAACAPVLGRLGDALSRRVTLLLGVAVFTLGNVLSALASSLPFMLAARFVVGLGTAAMAPVILSYIVSEFPKDKMAGGFSLYMLISSASVIFGPTLGSLMIARFGWRSMLWLCAGLCAITFLLCALTARRSPARADALSGFDWPGAALVLVFFSLLLCVPSFAQNFGWSSSPFLWTLSGAVAALAALMAVERRASQPILPGHFLFRPSFVLSVLALFLTQGLMQANMTNLIVFLNYTQPSSPISGYAISVMYLGMSLGTVALGPLADRLEPKFVLCGSFSLTALSCLLFFAFSLLSPAWLIMLSLGLLGFGLGGNATIFLKIVLSGLPPERAGACTGTYGLFRDLSAPFGVAVLVPLFTNRVSALIASGAPAPDAALSALHTLAAVEVVCVLAGTVLVLFLPRLRPASSADQGDPSSKA